MSKQYEDWADWAGDHHEEAQAELRKQREWAEHRRIAARANILDRDGADSAAMYAAERETCEHAEVSPSGYCANCGIEVEGWEPDDAQLLTQFGTKVPA